MTDKHTARPDETVTLNFDTGQTQLQTQLCTECWCRKHIDQFTDTSDVCSDCLDQ